MRRVIMVVCAACIVAWTHGAACAQSQMWQTDSFGDGSYGEDMGNAASAMRMRIYQATDKGLSRSEQWALNPCTVEDSPRMRAFCWSSYGRDLHIVLPELAFNAVAMLQPHTLFSYKALDVRFPPALRLRLPYNASATVGYEYDDTQPGIRLRWQF